MVCTGCGIGEGLNTEALVSLAGELGAATTKTHPALCGPDGLKCLNEAVDAENADGDLALRVEDVEAGRLTEARADLVVLATGMVPNTGGEDLPWALKLDEDGFALDQLAEGVTVAGVARRPQDVAASVRDATGAAAKAWMVAEGRR